MQKAALVAALIGTVGLTIYAYPGANKRTAAIFSTTAASREQDGPVQTPLDKLKAATRLEQPRAHDAQSILPAPKVMENVRQELLARPAQTAAAPLASPAQPASSGQATGNPDNKSAAADPAMEKLATRLPIGLSKSTQPSPAAPAAAEAPVQAATLVLPGAKSIVRPASGPAAPMEPAAGSAAGDAAKTAEADDTVAPVKPERKRVVHRTRTAAAHAREASTGPRTTFISRDYRRFDGN